MIAGVYARKSNAQDTNEENKSVTRQVEHAKAYATEQGWVIAEDHIYIDDGISGAEFIKRPGFIRLMTAVAGKPRPFDVLVISESSRLGREQIATSYAMQQIVQAGIRIFSYLEKRERTLQTPTDKLLMSVTAFADELERERTRLRVRDGMVNRARNGHHTGGQTFGYDRVETTGANGKRSHVDLRVNAREADVVRRIFMRCAEGAGVKKIAAELNREQAACPRPHQGRRPSWAMSTVRTVLFREAYRGQKIWNRHQKRDAFGQRQSAQRPASDWLRIDAPHLRIVTDEQWHAAHQRIKATAATYVRSPNGHMLGRPSTGLEGRHLLTGIAECALCHGGFMRRHAGRLTNGCRREYYGCTSRNNHGETACKNDVPLPLQLADEAVLNKLSTYVLRPDMVEGAIVDAIAALQPSANGVDGQRATLEAELRSVDAEAARLAEALARGGDIKALVDALRDRERQQARLQQQIAGLDGLRQVSDFDVRRVERDLHARVREWRGLLRRQTPISRQIVTKLLDGRLVFTPREDRSYEFSGRANFGKILKGIVVPWVFDRRPDATVRSSAARR